jgi:hypothetical protein
MKTTYLCAQGALPLFAAAGLATLALSHVAPGPPADAPRRAIEAPSLATPRDVERYLRELEDRARRNRQITALEVDPGLAAIRGVDDPVERLEMEIEFLRRMHRLVAELR